MKFGSLFTGCGAMDSGLQNAGMECVWQVEIDDFKRDYFLEHYFPHAKQFTDVKNVGRQNLEPVDLICGGFPCQNISITNNEQTGLDGEQSGLWREMFRIVRELRPRYALVENVARLVTFGLDRVLADLASIGFDAEWQTLQASDFGYPNERKRFFMVAYDSRIGLEKTVFTENGFKTINHAKSAEIITTYLDGVGRFYPRIPGNLLLDDGFPGWFSDRAVKRFLEQFTISAGNAVVPEIAEFIGRQILEFDKNCN